MKIHPDHGYDYTDFNKTIDVLRTLPQALYGFTRGSLFISDDYAYFRVKPYGDTEIARSNFKPKEFEEISEALESYIFPRIDEGMRSITKAIQQRKVVPLVLYQQPYKERSYDEGRVAFKITDKESGVDFFLMPPTKKDLQLAVYSVDHENINHHGRISVVTIIARKGNERIQCFLIEGKRIVPSVSDYGYIVGGDTVTNSGYQHYGYENMLEYFLSKGFNSMEEYWENKHKRGK